MVLVFPRVPARSRTEPASFGGSRPRFRRNGDDGLPARNRTWPNRFRRPMLGIHRDRERARGVPSGTRGEWGEAPRTGIEPVSLRRQRGCDASRITRQREPWGDVRESNPSLSGHSRPSSQTSNATRSPRPESNRNLPRTRRGLDQPSSEGVRVWGARRRPGSSGRIRTSIPPVNSRVPCLWATLEWSRRRRVRDRPRRGCLAPGFQ